jgi:hypothetical protein
MRGLTTASFAAHLPANDAVGSGAEVQYLISSEVKFRSRKVAEVGTALINSVSTLHISNETPFIKLEK